ncbi:Na+/H+ antiporter NhaA [Dongia deserti]|uniref:Na+/H+ antiporter NhaA n=1 Tax=Dongia deserti TaxID=2268030 RepID=UPI000E648E32|nr:Na+/H+ antiporter NhaA [Dongia deserti]
MPLSTIRDFLRRESAGGFALLGAALLALALTNSPLAGLYHDFFALHLTVKLGDVGFDKSLNYWINDGLMAIFFFLVGLEIKRELIEGELSSPTQAALPAIAAIGGMVAPAAIYVLVNAGTPATLDGWAIPAATDIAFAMGVLGLLSNRVPDSLKIFLLALAIIDDLGAIIIIAIFYTADLSLQALGLASIGVTLLFVMNRLNVQSLAAYVLVGFYVWSCVLQSGVHATLAGTVVALFVPLRVPRDEDEDSLLKRCIDGLHPWVAFGIVPVFAFANAGVSLDGVTWETIVAPVTLGVALGLFIGKQAGVMAAIALAHVTRVAHLPQGTTWREAYGVAVLTGIGFTMSLFIGGLAFRKLDHIVEMRLGVIAGSILSAAAGLLVLMWATRHRTAEAATQ